MSHVLYVLEFPNSLGLIIVDIHGSRTPIVSTGGTVRVRVSSGAHVPVGASSCIR